MSARKLPSLRKEKIKVCPCGKPCTKKPDEKGVAYHCPDHGIVYRN